MAKKSPSIQRRSSERKLRIVEEPEPLRAGGSQSRTQSRLLTGCIRRQLDIDRQPSTRVAGPGRPRPDRVGVGEDKIVPCLRKGTSSLNDILERLVSERDFQHAAIVR